MKNIYKITLSAGLTLLFAGCGSAPSTPATPAEVKASDEDIEELEQILSKFG